MGNVTRSQRQNIKTLDGNGLSVFVDGTSGELMIKDIRGNVQKVSDYINGGGSSILTADIPVVLSGTKSLGKYTNGQTIPCEGWTFQELMEDIALEYVNPAFTSFTVSGQSTTIEVGVTLSGSKTFNWAITENSGDVNTIDIFDNTASATLLAGTPNDGTQAVVINTIQLNSNNATQSWRGIANNDTGSNVNSNNFVVTSLFYRYWGATATLPANPADGTANRVYAEALPSRAFKTNGTNTFTLVTGTVQTRFVVILPPSVTITNVIDTTNLNANLTSDYILSSLTVKDAGGTDRSFNMYVYETSIPYSTSANHVITTN